MRVTTPPEIQGNLRRHMIHMPKVIEQVSGIRIFGRLIRSIAFSTDIAVIRNCNANAVMAVYPFTPQPAISHAIISASDVPVFCGVGGGTTTGKRVVNLAMNAEFEGAIGVVLNAPTSNEVLARVRQRVDIPVVMTVASEFTDIGCRLDSGATILNVSCAARTPFVVDRIRCAFPQVPIIATGGPTEETILSVIDAGANAVTYTPPTNGEIFRDLMVKYRSDDAALAPQNLPEDF
ncbi:hydrolase [Intestinibacillus massiliensis]|uniref:hydrolase n=1 Tax=Intestinibacillus massiliensis TaxID=1871029 RepID=UPI000B353398|nr:hydrolase [Intestinibacillus massiliensis]